MTEKNRNTVISDFTLTGTGSKAGKRSRERGGKYEILKNSAICAAIAAGVWILSIAGASGTGGTDGVRAAAKSELIGKEKLGMLTMVASRSVTDSLPDGGAVAAFSDADGSARITGEPNADVQAVFSGTVAYTDDNTVTVQNDDGTRSTYTGVSPTAKTGQYVCRADKIGVLNESLLCLETK